MAADSTSLHNPSKPHKHQQNSSRSPSPSSSFIYKAAFVCVLIAILPIFPSGSPEPSSTKNKTILARGLELLHLLLVGVAISYGLFSRRNSDHPHPELDKEAQTWKNYSRYNPEEPLVVVDAAREEALFLLEGSLISAEGDRVGKECTALPSPIPWRSRSFGRWVEVEEEPTPAFGLDAEMGPSEDSARKKSFQKSSPPPAPPPPPPRPLGRHRYRLGVEKKDEEVEHLSNGLGPYGGRSVRTVRPPALPRNESVKRDELGAKMVMVSDSSDSEEDDDGESSVERAGTEEEKENEVDKKADEFIAKFREQIRLQRIASLKRLAEQRTQSDS